MSETTSVYVFTNDRTDIMKLWIEPWVTFYEVAPGSNVSIHVSHSPTIKSEPEFQFTSFGATIYFWESCTIQVFVDGVEDTRQQEFFSRPSPPAPPFLLRTLNKLAGPPSQTD